MEGCVVIGAGPAGLAASAALTARGVDHVVVERARVGQSWRSQRWDSLRLNNPGWMNSMLGDQPRDTYLTAAEVVERLEVLARSSPVREDTPVLRLAADEDGWVLGADGGRLRARTVVVATGGENVPRTPPLTRLLPPGIEQHHAADYRRPDQLPDGVVLVVGSAQSGYQIAEELLAAGRRVILATSPVGRAPARHRGRDTVEWLVESGFFDQRPEALPDRAVIGRPQPLLAPGGRSASLQRLAAAGATLVGRLIAVDGSRLAFDDSTMANIAAGDAFAAGVRAMLDDLIRRSGQGAPPTEPDEADLPVVVHPPQTIDLRTARVTSVIWATGYTGDFSWLPPSLTDHRGQPIRSGPAAVLPGVWYVGLRWLTRRSSGNFLGFPTDAAVVADAVAATLRRRTRTPEAMPTRCPLEPRSMPGSWKGSRQPR